MSIITPAGNKKLDWSPEIKKEASVETVDALYKAAQDFFGDKKDEAVEEVKEVKEDVVVEPIAEEKAEATRLEQAVEKIEEAVVEVKEVVEEEKGEVEKAEGTEEVSVEVVPQGEDIVIESKPEEVAACACGKAKEECGCGKKEEPVMQTSAATEEEFCKFAKLTPENKRKLESYWTGMLGYPKDYVKLMTKDYEK